MSKVIKMSTFNKEQLPFGCEYWVMLYQSRVPRMEVFRFVAFDADKGMYWFRSLTEKSLVSRNINQLAGNPWFKPFLVQGGKA